MNKRLVLGTLSGFIAACSSGPPRENLPERTASTVERHVKPDEIVALVNGQPLTWQAVAEKVLELNPRESVDQYVRWKIVDDRRAALGIVHTPEELRRRAAAYLEQAKKQLGEERFRRQLAREGATEDSKRAQLEGSATLAQLFTLDKIVRFAALLEDQVEIDRVYFADEAEARRFHEAVAAKGFDAAAQELLPEPKSGRGRLPREVFPKSQPPADPVLDPWILEELLKLTPGSNTGVEMSRSNLYYVVRLLGIRKGRPVVYSQVREEVLESILKDPPGQQDYLRWMEREMVRCRIEYSDSGSKREKKGSP
ncbi:MAG: peptidyl-prolyl cis-trans isomerase [Planctomycetes bacterium]|nr:peptidyl-prolyl cis-trans isomerase [Planctomycetota bacterium]